MTKLKCKIKYFRHLLQFDHQYEFAKFLGVSKFSCNQWEQGELPNLMSSWKIFNKIKDELTKRLTEEEFKRIYPAGFHFEDLFEELSDES
jgi:DNA-binding XRE family transcriptional regulator